MIDFTLAPEHEAIRAKVRDFVENHIKPAVEPFGHRDEMDPEKHRQYVGELIRLRKLAVKEGLWLPHMPKEWGGMGLGHVALAMVQAEAAKTRVGPWVFNCQAPDEGNMHTLVHWATPEQKEKYLKPLCDGVSSSCFAMTEPEVAGSDPTLIRTHAIKDGDEWIITAISGLSQAPTAPSLQFLLLAPRWTFQKGLEWRILHSSLTYRNLVGTMFVKLKPCMVLVVTARS